LGLHCGKRQAECSRGRMVKEFQMHGWQ
jgi:hypothetical protein